MSQSIFYFKKLGSQLNYNHKNKNDTSSKNKSKNNENWSEVGVGETCWYLMGWWAWVIKPKIGCFFQFLRVPTFSLFEFSRLPTNFPPTCTVLTDLLSLLLQHYFSSFHWFSALSLSQLCLATPLSIFANVKLIKWWLKEEKETRKAKFNARRREILIAMAFLGHLV